jgi:hypothetical protein
MAYNLYRATVVEQPTIDDPRTTVKIATLMDNIEDLAVLPKYPSFYSYQLLNYPMGSMVWCVCNDTFDIGYVLGTSNIFSDTLTKYLNYSKIESNFKDIAKKTIAGINIGLQKFKDLLFLYVDANLMETIDTSTGTKIIYHSTGSLFVIGPYGIFSSFGNAIISISKNPSNGKDQIILSADTIRLNGKVALGNGNKSGYVLTSKTPGVRSALNDGSIVISSDSVVV